MLLKRAVGVALLALTGLAVAQEGLRPSAGRLVASKTMVGRAGPAAQRAALQPRAAEKPQGDISVPELIPRQALPKIPSANLFPPATATGRLLVKFNDEVEARRLSDHAIMSMRRRDLSLFEALLKDFGATLEPVFSKSEDELAAVAAQAAAYSGKAQPDLAGMMYVTAPGGVPVRLAKAINDLDVVEFTDFEQVFVPAAFQQTGACCFPNNNCQENIDANTCTTNGGVFQGPGSTCNTNNPTEPSTCGACCQTGGACTEPTSADVCITDLGGSFQGTATTCTADGCEFGACCLSPTGMCIETFRADCDSQAGSFRGDGTTCGAALSCGACCRTDGSCLQGVSQGECEALPPDQQGPGVFQGGGTDCQPPTDCSQTGEPDCGIGGTGSCSDPNGSAFCTDETCCEDVCDLDPFCCDEQDQIEWNSRKADNANNPGISGWDAWCADHALEICQGVETGATNPNTPPSHPGTFPSPNFTAAQGYLTEFGWGPPQDIAQCVRYDNDGRELPGYTGEGWDLDAIWAVGEALLQTGLGTVNQARGHSIKVGVIDKAAYVANGLRPAGQGTPFSNHEDLATVVTETGTGGQFLILQGPNDDFYDAHHGTASLGIIAATDNDSSGAIRTAPVSPATSRGDQMGMVGVAADATPYFFSSATLAGGNVEDAILRAIADTGGDFGPGDVLAITLQPTSSGSLASLPGPFTLISTATSMGVTCVIPAGNHCENLDDFPQFSGDSGAIIVGAGFPGSPDSSFMGRCRMPFSNYCRTCDQESRIHTSGWGTAVASLGHFVQELEGGHFDACKSAGGDLYFPSGDPNRAYTYRFGGTSGAAAQIAGVVACLQGLAKQRWDIPLSPFQIRDEVIDDEGLSQFQCGFAEFMDVPGNNDVPQIPCRDFNWLFSHGDFDKDAVANQLGASVGVYSDANDDADKVVTGDFFSGNQLIDGFNVLHGTLISGNVFSLKASDNNFLVIGSQVSLPTGPGVVQRGVLGSGDTTDLEVLAHANTTMINNVTVQVESHVNTSNPTVMVIYLFDYLEDKWVVIAASILTFADPPNPIPFPAPINPARFVQSGTNNVRIRVWTLALGVSSGYQVFHDLVGFNAGSNPFVPDPP